MEWKYKIMHREDKIPRYLRATTAYASWRDSTRTAEDVVCPRHMLALNLLSRSLLLARRGVPHMWADDAKWS